MGILRYAVAAGIGYYAGQPEGRRQLTKLRQQAAELVRSPEAKRVRERGWDMVGEGVLAARNAAARTRSKEKSGGAAGDAGTAGAERSGSGLLRGRIRFRRAGAGSAATADPATGEVGTTAPESPAGFDGTTVAEDSKAAVLGISPPPVAARTSTPAPSEDRS